jgi:hypothetical protein
VPTRYGSRHIWPHPSSWHCHHAQGWPTRHVLRRTDTLWHAGQHTAVICARDEPSRTGSRVSGGGGGRSTVGMKKSLIPAPYLSQCCPVVCWRCALRSHPVVVGVSGNVPHAAVIFVYASLWFPPRRVDPAAFVSCLPSGVFVPRSPKHCFCFFCVVHFLFTRLLRHSRRPFRRVAAACIRVWV